MIYGFPMVDGPAGGAKVAREQYVVETTADDLDRTVTADEIEEMYETLRPRPAAGAVGSVREGGGVPLHRRRPTAASSSTGCPRAPDVIVASPCSGHGFKHSAAIGESLAQLATRGESDLDLSAFGWPATDEPR